MSEIEGTQEDLTEEQKGAVGGEDPDVIEIPEDEDTSDQQNQVEDLGPRKRTYTIKGQAYRVDTLRSKSMSAFSSFNRAITKLYSTMENAYSRTLVNERCEVERKFKLFSSAHTQYASSLEEDEELLDANVGFTKALETFNRTIAAVATVINRLDEEEVASVRSRDQGLSRKSIKSRRSAAALQESRSEVAAEEAAIKVELEFANEEARLRQEQEKLHAEFSKLKLEREHAKVAAREQALSRLDDDAYTRRDEDFPVHAPLFVPAPNGEHVTSPSPRYPFTPRAVTPTRAANSSLNPGAPPFTAAETTIERSNYGFLPPRVSFPTSFARQERPHLPFEEPEVFRGEKLKFPIWIARFEELIERHVKDPVRRLSYLNKYTAGEPNEAIQGFLVHTTEDDFQEAKRILRKWWGDPSMITAEYKKRLRNWSVISTTDGGKSLRSFSNFLNSCKRMIKNSAYLSTLDDEELNQTLAVKLSKFSRERWAGIVAEYKKTNPRFPPFSVFCKHVEDEAFLATQPVVGTAILDQIVAENRKANPPQNRGKNFKPARSFVTNTSTETKDKELASKIDNGPNQDSSCLCCQQSHDLIDCRVLADKEYDGVVDFIHANKLCFGCLRHGHLSKECRQRLKCEICQKGHPTIIHTDRRIGGRSRRGHTPSNDPSQERKNTACFATSLGDAVKTTRIVPIWINHRNDPSKKLKILAALDEQSDTTFVSEEVRQMLNLQGPEVRLRISSVAVECTVDAHKLKGLSIEGCNGKVINLPTCYSRDAIPIDTEQIVSKAIAKKHPKYQVIAEEIPEYDPDTKVGLLIGTDCIQALRPLEVISDPSSDSYAVKSALGWSIVGLPTRNITCDTRSRAAVCNRIGAQDVTIAPVDVQTFVPLNQTKELMNPTTLLQSFERDFSEYKSNPRSLGNGVHSEKAMSVEDRKFLQKCRESIRIIKDGRYELSLSFRDGNPRILNNKSQAIKRLLSIKKRMDFDEIYKQQYFEFMRKVASKGFIERVAKEDLGEPGRVFYLPHHGVYHPLKPNKIRIVYDASAKFHGTSLNDLLLSGPSLTNSIVGVLIRFRRNYYCFIADLEQMFYSVSLDPRDRDFFRFLWWDDEDTSKNPVEYRMTVHCFGATSSPGCSMFALKQTAEDNKAEFGESTAKVLTSNSYVDDILVSCESIEEAINMVKSTKKMCKKGGFILTKFSANHPQILSEISAEERSSLVKNLDVDCETQPVLRTLGVEWCIESDSFMFRITLKDRPFTRRGILATVCSVFDPLGFISPVVLEGKKILQTLVRDHKDWDEEVPESLKSRWEKWRMELPELAKVKIRRCFKPKEFGRIKKAELHHFSDASSYAYGECSYLRLIDHQGRFHCSLVMGKSRVAPLKPVTIPRLELTAAVVSVRVGDLVRNELEYNDISEYYWTDSRVVLGYISNESRRFHIYVANRVQEIHERSKPENWFFVGTKDNPADDASRGLRPRNLTEDCRYLKGPSFLWHSLGDLQNARSFNELHGTDLEVKKATTLSTKGIQQFPSLLERISRFSSWYKALKFVAILKKIKVCLLVKSKAKKGGFESVLPISRVTSVSELEEAQVCILKLVQGEVFTEEVKALDKIGQRNQQSERLYTRQRKCLMKKTSNLYRLQPYLDAHGLLRVGGRLELANLSEELKHPIVLPKSHHVTKLLIRYFHAKNNHQGRGMTHNVVRESGFWIIGGTSAISNCISKCTVCQRLRGRFIEQKMADLPPDRTESVAPFTFCGVDIFGPWIIKEGRKELKRYGVLFTCLSSRAIRIEVSPTMETDSFLNAMRRFICRNGTIRQIRCDRGSNFMGASRELREAYNAMNHDKIHNFLLQEKCDYFPFKFNVPAASYQGGVWERQIRSVRSVLSAILLKNGQQLDDDSLRTFMIEAEAVVNSRPLTVENLASADGPLPLTPNHILTLKTRLVLPPPGSFGRPDLYLRKRWRRVQHLANEFWQRWRKEFLQSLQERVKWNKVRRDLKISDIVIVADDNLPRNGWKLATVTNLYPNEDGHVRKVQCRIADSRLDSQGRRIKDTVYLDRPIQKLILFLESEDTKG